MFYFMMGIYVHLDAQFFRSNFGWSLLVSGLNVFLSPLMFCLLGWISGLKARSTIYMSCLSNSLGETTLTLQVLAYEAGTLA